MNVTCILTLSHSHRAFKTDIRSDLLMDTLQPETRSVVPHRVLFRCGPCIDDGMVLKLVCVADECFLLV